MGQALFSFHFSEQFMTRLSQKNALELYQTSPIETLQQHAHDYRMKKHPSSIVTFITNTNPNYTNICSTACLFCSFCRKKVAPDAYILTREQFEDLVRSAQKNKISCILLQGGLHEAISLEYLISLLSISQNIAPEIHPHFFSAPEIVYAASVSKIPLQEALKLLWASGLRTIPGGGAEILSERVHAHLSPKKLTPSQWLSFHKTAHDLGFKTTATMMFGHIETAQEMIHHLDQLRSVQDETNGFLSFIPWSYKAHGNVLGKIVSQQKDPEKYLRIISISRLYLDNFPHISASWFGEGKATGKRALHFGADDFGGTLQEEHVHKAAGHTLSTTRTEISEMISTEGFIPRERDAFYRIIPLERENRDTLPRQPQEGR